MPSPLYTHRQTSPIRFPLIAVIVVSLLAGWSWRWEFWAWFSMFCLAGVSGLVLFSMTTLTIQADEEALLVRFGPVPLFRTRIAYADIRGFRANRSRVIDGWGIHFIPGRGWTWSLWGFDCVDIELNRGTIRVGTDDALNLAAFLHSRVSTNPA
jgi:hypothetical protein